MRTVHILKHVLLGAIAISVFSFAVMLLWNWLMPAIFGCTVICFWQALGLLALSRILLGGMGRWRWSAGRHHHHHHRNPIREKWMTMTDDERKEFLEKRHCGPHGFGYDFFRENKSEKQE